MAFFSRWGRLFASGQRWWAAIQNYRANGDFVPLAREALAYYQEHGKMIRLNLDSNAKQIFVEVHFQGEAEPLTLNVDRYEVIEGGAGSWSVRLHGVRTSRPWLNAAMKAMRLEGREFPLPEPYAELIALTL